MTAAIHRKAADNAIAQLRKTFVKVRDGAGPRNIRNIPNGCTLQILDILGGLNRMGWLPDDRELKEMIEEAVKYVDRTTAAEFARYPKSDFTMYCYMRLKYPI